MDSVFMGAEKCSVSVAEQKVLLIGLSNLRILIDVQIPARTVNNRLLDPRGEGGTVRDK